MNVKVLLAQPSTRLSPSFSLLGRKLIQTSHHTEPSTLNCSFVQTVAEMALDGALLSSFSHPALVEPVAVATSQTGEVVVADTGVRLYYYCALHCYTMFRLESWCSSSLASSSL